MRKLAHFKILRTSPLTSYILLLSVSGCHMERYLMISGSETIRANPPFDKLVLGHRASYNADNVLFTYNTFFSYIQEYNKKLSYSRVNV